SIDSLYIKWPRSAGLILDQGPSSKALFAAFTALFISSSTASLTFAKISPLAGLYTSKDFPETESTNSPLINNCFGLFRKSSTFFDNSIVISDIQPTIPFFIFLPIRNDLKSYISCINDLVELYKDRNILWSC